MLHQVHDTDRCDLFRWHLDQVVAEFGLARVYVTSLDENLLLLSNHGLKSTHPVDDVPVRSCQLVCAPYFNQVV